MNDSSIMQHVPLVLRCIQFVFSLIAMATAAGGFAKRESGDFDVQLGSTEFNFILLSTFAAWLMTFGWIVSTIGLKRAQPQPIVTLIVDGIFVIFFFSGGIAAAVSDYVKDCDRYGNALRCGTLKTSVAFTFLSMAAFLGTLVITVLTFRSDSSDNGMPDYGEAHTPTASPAIPQAKYVAPSNPSV